MKGRSRKEKDFCHSLKKAKNKVLILLLLRIIEA